MNSKYTVDQLKLLRFFSLTLLNALVIVFEKEHTHEVHTIGHLFDTNYVGQSHFCGIGGFEDFVRELAHLIFNF